MIKNLNWTRITIICAIFIPMILLLNNAFWHTSALLIRVNHAPWVAYLSAFGWDVTIIIFSIALGLGTKANSKIIYYGMFGFLLFGSIYANTLEGFYIRTQKELTLENWIIELDPIQIIGSLIFTAGIPLSIFGLSHIFGDYIKQEFTSYKAAINKERRQEERKDKIANIGKSEQRRQAEIFATFQQQSNGSLPVLNKDLAGAHGVSGTVIKRDIGVLVEDGKLIKREGKRGYDVTK